MGLCKNGSCDHHDQETLFPTGAQVIVDDDVLGLVLYHTQDGRAAIEHDVDKSVNTYHDEKRIKLTGKDAELASLRAQLAAAQAESESRRKVLDEKSAELQREWQRAENAEAECERLRVALRSIAEQFSAKASQLSVEHWAQTRDWDSVEAYGRYDELLNCRAEINRTLNATNAALAARPAETTGETWHANAQKNQQSIKSPEPSPAAPSVGGNSIERAGLGRAKHTA